MNTSARMLLVLVGLVSLTGCGNISRMLGASALAEDNPGFLVGPVLQNATATSIGIMWETGEGDESAVDFGTSPSMGQTVAGDVIESTEHTRIHHTTLSGLTPDTKYFYLVRTGEEESPIFQFTTPPAKGSTKPFRFAVYSDCQQRPGVHKKIVDQGIYGTMPTGIGTPDEALSFVLVAGDVVQDGENYGQYRERLFDPTRNVSPYVPYYAAIGNHERNNQSFFDYLDLPQNGSPGYEEHWYSFQHGNTHVIGLDTNSAYQIPKQLEWLDQDLAQACNDPDTSIVFAFFHHPWKSELWLPGEEAYSGEIVQRLEKTLQACNKVGAYFFGHTHGYSRGQSKDTRFYAVNVGSAGGTIDNWDAYPQRDYPEFQLTYDEYGVLIVDVNPLGKTGFSAKRLTFGDEKNPKSGEVQDDFHVYFDDVAPEKPVISSVTKQPNGASFLVRSAASEFVDPDGGKHLESEWQLASKNTDFAAPEESQWLRSQNIFRDVDTMAGKDIKAVEWTLPAQATRFVRVRYRDDGLTWSPWSDAVSVDNNLSFR